jgi:hypothetical protein
LRGIFVVGILGLEPRKTAPKTVVLPLNQIFTNKSKAVAGLLTKPTFD